MMSRPERAAAFHEDLIEDCDLPPAILLHRFDQGDVRLAGPTQSAKPNAPAILGPLPEIRDDIDRDETTRRQNVGNGTQR